MGRIEGFSLGALRRLIRLYLDSLPSVVVAVFAAEGWKENLLRSSFLLDLLLLLYVSVIVKAVVLDFSCACQNGLILFFSRAPLARSIRRASTTSSSSSLYILIFITQTNIA